MNRTASEAEGMAKQIRRDVLRMCHGAHSAHIGSSFSCIDILSTLYIGKIMQVRPKEPMWNGRDYFILSKGHASAALYATLARAGFYPAEKLDSYYQDDSEFPGHPSMGCVSGVEVSSGSLGHGLGIGCGIAEAIKRDGGKNRVFVLLSDGEMDEGSTWEAILYAGAKKLDNLVGIVDYNKIQSFGMVEEVLDLEPLADKTKAFGWETARLDGNSCQKLQDLLESSFMKSEKPKMVIADTVKGKGVTFMEGKLEWHYRTMSEAEYKQALEELV